MKRVTPTVVLALGIAAIFAARAFAGDEKEPKEAPANDRITVDFTDKTLPDLFELLQQHTGAFLLYPEVLKNKPAFASGVHTMTRRQFVSVFQAILEQHSHTMVSVAVWPGVVITKVVQSPAGRNYPGPTFSKEEVLAKPELLANRQDMVTVIYPLRYAQAMNVQAGLQSLIDPRGGTIFGIPNVDVLVMTDFAPSVRRMVEIITLMDVPGPPATFEVVRFRHAPSEDLLPILQQLTAITRDYQQQRGGGQPPTSAGLSFVLDERTNSILVQGQEEEIEPLRRLVAELDVPLDFEPSGIHVYTLKHTNAEDVSATVNELLQSVTLRQLQGAFGGQAGDGAAPGGPGGPVPVPPPAAPGPATQDDDRRRVAAIADTVTNSVIVVAGEAEYRVIETIIASLDIRRPQVLIEAVVCVASEGEDFTLGVELTTLDGSRDGSVRGFGATRFGFSNLVDAEGTPLLGAGIPGGQFPSQTSGVLGVHRGKEWRIPAILELAGSDSDVNVMSLPRIVTDDNKEATLKVADKRPIATSTSTAAVSNQVGFGGFQEAGIEIKITPHISEGDYLRLEMDQTFSEFTGVAVTVGDVLLPPPKVRREMRNVITVPDGKTVIIGGLTERYQQTTVSKVPLLGDIPLLGELFRRTKKDWKRKNFYVFITPHIIRGDRLRDFERLSGTHLAEASRVGVATEEADRYYRGAFGDEARLAATAAGEPVSLMEYRGARR